MLTSTDSCRPLHPPQRTIGLADCSLLRRATDDPGEYVNDPGVRRGWLIAYASAIVSVCQWNCQLQLALSTPINAPCLAAPVAEFHRARAYHRRLLQGRS